MLYKYNCNCFVVEKLWPADNFLPALSVIQVPDIKKLLYVHLGTFK